MNKPKAIISLFDLTGAAVRPWADAKYHTFQFDMQHAHGLNGKGRNYTIGGDASTWTETLARIFEAYDVAIVFGFPPCTSLAISGARHFQAKAAANPNYRAEAMALVYMARDIGEAYGVPYAIENPISVISSEWRKPDHMFQPCDFGGYLPEDDTSPYPDIIPARDAYTKKTCLWTGNGFKMPAKRPVDPVKYQDRNGLNYSALHWKLGGKSLRTKNIRSATPRGFAQAVFAANS
jgi:hypothetical protein